MLRVNGIVGTSKIQSENKSIKYLNNSSKSYITLKQMCKQRETRNLSFLSLGRGFEETHNGSDSFAGFGQVFCRFRRRFLIGGSRRKRRGNFGVILRRFFRLVF